MKLRGRRAKGADEWRQSRWYAEIRRLSQDELLELHQRVDEIRQQRLIRASKPASSVRLLRTAIEESERRQRS